MLIIIDSNILISNFFMRSTSFEVMEKVGTIVIGEIVMDEVVNKYKEMLTEQIQKARTSLDTINRFLTDKHVDFSSEIDIASEAEKYKDFLEMYILQSGLTIPECYPNISHKEVVKRALDRKKPFKANGAGYRDFLVWSTVLEVARSYAGETIHFITENTQDFSDSKQKDVLHRDLQEDLDRLGISRDRFHYWSSVKSFVDNYAATIAKQIDKHDALVDEIQANKSGFQIPVHDYVEQAIAGRGIDAYDVPYLGENGFFHALEILSDIDIENISEINSEEYLLSLHLDAIGMIHSSALISDLQNYREAEFEFDIIKQDGMTCEIESEVGVQIGLRAIYNKEKNAITSIELEDLSDYFCPYCN